MFLFMLRSLFYVAVEMPFGCMHQQTSYINNALLKILYLYCFYCMTGLNARLISLEARVWGKWPSASFFIPASKAPH